MTSNFSFGITPARVRICFASTSSRAATEGSVHTISSQKSVTYCYVIHTVPYWHSSFHLLSSGKIMWFNVFWISTGWGHDALIKSEEGKRDRKLLARFAKLIVSRTLKMAKKFKLSLKVSTLRMPDLLLVKD